MSQRKCTIRILDEVNCVLIGLIPTHVSYFYEEYGKFAPNYFFNPKFKLGSWDGKIRYFHKTGATHVNLLPEIIPTLIRLKYVVNVEDNRQIKSINPPLIYKNFLGDLGVIDLETGEPWEMREYQVNMVNALTQNGGGVGICGTGGGKTSMSAALAHLYERASQFRSIIIVPDKSLTEQTIEEYKFFKLDVGEYSGDRKDIKHMHVVSTWQSLKNNPHLIKEFNVVIVDECHGLRGQVLTKLLNEYGNKIGYRFGVTGTLPKAETDAMAVRIAVGEVQYIIPASELIQDGYLATLDINILQAEVDLKHEYQEFLQEFNKDPANKLSKAPTYIQFKNSYFPDFQSEKRFLETEKKRLDWIAHNIKSKADQGKGNVLCLVNSIRFGKKLASMIDGAVFLYGKDKTKARKEVYDLFKTHDNLIVIASAKIASTGLNIKRIFNLMYIDMGKSFIRVIQTIGRGLRKAPDKDYVNVTDICSDLKYSKRHLRERIKFYTEAKYPYKKLTIDINDKKI